MSDTSFFRRFSFFLSGGLGKVIDRTLFRALLFNPRHWLEQLVGRTEKSEREKEHLGGVLCRTSNIFGAEVVLNNGGDGVEEKGEALEVRKKGGGCN